MGFLGYAWVSMVIRLNIEAGLVKAPVGMRGKGSPVFDHRIKELQVFFHLKRPYIMHVDRDKIDIDVDIKYQKDVCMICLSIYLSIYLSI